MRKLFNSHGAAASQMLIAGMIVGGVCLSTGCTGPTTREERKLVDFFQVPEWTKTTPWTKEKEEELPEPYPNPVKLAVTWTPDVLVQPGRTPTRGFGGRLFFFDEKSKAVPVEGTLTIHGFEGESNNKKTQIRPFKFTPEQFTKHFGQSDFGASYSIWIPWDPAGGEQKRVSMVATFESTAGGVVQGSPTTIVLPGHTEEQEQQHMAAILSPQFRVHQDAINQHVTRPSGLATTTIRRRLGGAKQDAPTAVASRLEAIAASKRGLASRGKTPFIDVSTSAPTPTVMKASAEIPADTRPRRIQVQSQ